MPLPPDPAPCASAAPAAGPGAAPALPRRRRAFWLLLAGLVVGLGLLAAWQLHDQLLRIALDRAVIASAGRLQIEGVQGHPLEGVSVRQLRWQADQGPTLQLQSLRLRWHWPALLHGRLVITRLDVQALHLQLPAEGEAAVPPASLALPLPIELRDLRIAQIHLQLHEQPAVVLRDLQLVADYDPEAGRYQVTRLALQSPWGQGSASGSVTDRAPYALNAQADAVLAWRGLGLKLQLGGSSTSLRWQGELLAAPGATAQAKPRPQGGEPAAAWLHAQGELRPGAPRWLDTVRWQAGSLSPADLGLPAHLAGSFEGQGELDWRSDAPQEGVELRLALRNLQPASWDRQGLPISQASARLRWRGGRWLIDDLQARLLDAESRLAGRMLVAPGEPPNLPWPAMPRLELALELAQVSLQALDARLPATRLEARLRLDAQGLDLDVRDAARDGVRLVAQGEILADRLRLQKLLASSLPGLGSASLQAKGWLQIAAPWALDLEGRIDALQADSAARLLGLGDAGLAGRVDARWSLRGALGETPQARALAVEARLERGELQGLALRGQAQATVGQARISGILLDLDLGGNRLRAQGDVGRADERLQFALDMPKLATLPLPPALAARWRAAGALRLSGSWAGSLQAPDLSLQGDGEGLRVAGLSGSRLKLNARWQDSGLMLQAQLADPAFQTHRAQQLELRFNGPLASHELTLDLQQGVNRWQARLLGALQPGRWQGELASWRLSGPTSARTVSPSPLMVDARGVQLGPLQIESEVGALRLARLVWYDGQFALTGAARLQRLASLARGQGFTPPVLPPGVDADALQLMLEADLQGGSLADLSGRLIFELTPPPGLRATAQARLALRQGALSGSLALDLPTLAHAQRWIGPGWLIDGRLALEAQLAGTLAAPRFNGSVRGEALKLSYPALGWHAGAGRMLARFDGDRLKLDHLLLPVGDAAIAASRSLEAAAEASGSSRTAPPGGLMLSGELGLADRRGRFLLQANAVALPLGPGQRLVISGQAEAGSQEARVELRGRLRVDSGLLDLRGSDIPELPADVQIVTPGGRGASAEATLAEGNGARARLASDAGARLNAELTLDLGDRLRVRGSGVDARLGGELLLRGSLPDTPRAFGTVVVREGSFSAYGQSLRIERGRVVFNGPIDNPLLDLSATRPNLPVTVGVNVTGSVLAPRIRLSSTPEMTDAQRLSWLVLGVAPDAAASAAQAAALQAAATSLLGSQDGGFAAAFGLDVLTVRPAGAGDAFAGSSGLTGLQSAAAVPGQIGGAGLPAVPSASAQQVVAVGKRLGPRLLLTYEQGLRGVWNLLRIQYDLGRRLSLRAQTGSESAIDLLYQLSFD